MASIFMIFTSFAYKDFVFCVVLGQIGIIGDTITWFIPICKAQHIYTHWEL